MVPESFSSGLLDPRRRTCCCFSSSPSSIGLLCSEIQPSEFVNSTGSGRAKPRAALPALPKTHLLLPTVLVEEDLTTSSGPRNRSGVQQREGIPTKGSSNNSKRKKRQRKTRLQARHTQAEQCCVVFCVEVTFGENSRLAAEDKNNKITSYSSSFYCLYSCHVSRLDVLF